MIPFKYAADLLSQPGGARPRYYFDTVLPQIEADGNADVCRPLTRAFQVAITRHTAGDDSSVLEVSRPLAPPRDTGLLNHAQSLVYHHFPHISPAAASAHGSAIATKLSEIYVQKEAHYQEARQERAAEKGKSIEKWLGADNFKRLLRLCRVSLAEELPALWYRLAAAKEKDRLAILQGAV